MPAQKPQKGVALVLLIVAVAVLALGGAATAALLGQAPTCSQEAGPARSLKEIGDSLDKIGSVTIPDAEATTLGRGYVGNTVEDLRVCATSGLGHASGSIKLGPFNPSFYASAGVDLSGSSPKATSLKIKIGSLPDIPVISAQAEKTVSDIVNQNLAKISLTKKYSASFAQGSVTISK